MNADADVGVTAIALPVLLYRRAKKAFSLSNTLFGGGGGIIKLPLF